MEMRVAEQQAKKGHYVYKNPNHFQQKRITVLASNVAQMLGGSSNWFVYCTTLPEYTQNSYSIL